MRARWWDFTGDTPGLEVLSTEEGRSTAVLEQVWRLPRGDTGFVTVVIPEQFHRPSLLSAKLLARTAFRLKLRLICKSGMVAPTSRPSRSIRGPKGTIPKRLAVRVS